MNKVNIKPLSVNRVWAGRRFKTPDYKTYEIELMSLLKGKLTVDKNEKIHLIIHAGISKSSDIDNLLKPFIDILQKRYEFNDKQIFKITASKETVKKGKEFISFDFKEYEC